MLDVIIDHIYLNDESKEARQVHEFVVIANKRFKAGMCSVVLTCVLTACNFKNYTNCLEFVIADEKFE